MTGERRAFSVTVNGSLKNFVFRFTLIFKNLMFTRPRNE